MLFPLQFHSWTGNEHGVKGKGVLFTQVEILSSNSASAIHSTSVKKKLQLISQIVSLSMNYVS